MAKKGFSLPIQFNPTPEQLTDLNRRSDEDSLYLELKDKQTLKEYMNVKSPLSRVGYYLHDFFKANPMGILTYKQIAKDEKLPEGTVQICVGRLAGWKNFPLVIIGIRKKGQKGSFQLHSKSMEDTERWITGRRRFIATSEQRLQKTENAVAARPPREKVKEKVEVKERKARKSAE